MISFGPLKKNCYIQLLNTEGYKYIWLYIGFPLIHFHSS